MKALVVSLRFLFGHYHGLKNREKGEVEWPPSPFRLFKALISASHKGAQKQKLTDERRDALRWLEDQTCSLIVTPKYSKGLFYKTYVPSNDVAINRNNEGLPKIVSSLDIDKDELLHYVWILTDDQESQKHIELISDMAKCIPYLGRGVDHVAVRCSVKSKDEVPDLKGIHWSANQLGRGNGLRIPIKGSYNEQIELYKRTGESIQQEGHVDAPLETEFVMQHFDQVVGYRPYVVFDLIGGQVPFSVSETINVAAMVRSASLERAKKLSYGSESFRSSVLGLHREHGDFGHRLSYLPLPGIHFDTKIVHAIRRVIVADLAGSDESVIEFVRNNMPGVKLTRPDKTVAACLSIADDEDMHRISAYCRPSREWVSVTPLVLEEYPPRGTTSSWFKKRVLEYSNIDPNMVETAEFIQYSLFKGIPLNKNFEMADNHKNKFTRHLRITFRQPYAGPLSIGTGKDRGLGLLVSSTQMPQPVLSDARKT